MESILVDTSVWIDWLNEKKVFSEQTNLLEMYFTQRTPVCTTAVILQEVLQGVRKDRDYEVTKEAMLPMPMLRLDPVEASIGAAQLYRTLRKKGITIRKPNDCLIAHYALVYTIPILHKDTDFDQIARHTVLRIATS